MSTILKCTNGRWQQIKMKHLKNDFWIKVYKWDCTVVVLSLKEAQKVRERESLQRRPLALKFRWFILPLVFGGAFYIIPGVVGCRHKFYNFFFVCAPFLKDSGQEQCTWHRWDSFYIVMKRCVWECNGCQVILQTGSHKSTECRSEEEMEGFKECFTATECSCPIGEMI